MYHYVYLLINPTDRRRYIGVRSSKVIPHLDSSYMSSCRVVTKEYLQECKKRVLKVFHTRHEAITFEIHLHSKYDVGVNHKFFNGAKQTSTKFDQTGLVSKKDNPNADTVYIFNESNTLMYTLEGELTHWNVDAPRYAFVKSHKNNGLRIGMTTNSRSELRKKLHQRFIGWYALKSNTPHTDFITSFNVDHEQVTGAHSKLTLRKLLNNVGTTNPNAKHYEVYNEKGTLLHTLHGNLDVFGREVLKISKYTLYQAIRDNKPIDGGKPTTRHLKGWTIIKKDT